MKFNQYLVECPECSHKMYLSCTENFYYAHKHTPENIKCLECLAKETPRDFKVLSEEVLGT